MNSFIIGGWIERSILRLQPRNNLVEEAARLIFLSVSIRIETTLNSYRYSIIRKRYCNCRRNCNKKSQNKIQD